IFTLDENTSQIEYSLDGGENVTINSNTTLSGLSEGSHSLKLYAEDHANHTGASEPVYFTVDTTPPTVSLLSPRNVTYSDTEIQVNFTTTQPISWTGYSLDNAANVTVTGNTTLPELSSGTHHLTVYANDTAGNMGSSETIRFTVDKSVSPVVWAVVAMGIVVVGVGVWWVYHRKRDKTADLT
ncbi:MAG: Ig-like domain-containing protein, partial [Thermoproteota archaeon]